MDCMLSHAVGLCNVVGPVDPYAQNRPFARLVRAVSGRMSSGF
jgi:hypothetical protein